MKLNPEHEKLVAATWEATGGDMPLGSFGGFQDLFDSIPFRQSLVAPVIGGKRFLVCIDERLIGSPRLQSSVANFVRMAGEGILNPHAYDDISWAEIDGIMAHSECKAKEMYAAGKEGHPDRIGLAAVCHLAGKTGIPVMDIIMPYQFRIPFHDARAIFYDGTDGARFDWSRAGAENFPIPGFIISRAIVYSSEYAQKEVDLAVKIAQGPGGSGLRFTDESPLYLVGITDNQPGSVRSKILRRELRQVADKHQAVDVDLILC